MPRNPEKTRTAIMDAAEDLILAYGFSGTTVSAIIEEAGVTKGAFFHHFDTKIDLGHALVERFAARDRSHLFTTMRRAEKLSSDPLQQVLIFVGLSIEEMEELTEPFPGCLFAAYCYQAQLFDEETLEVARAAMRLWRERVGAKLREVAERYPPADAIDVDTLADMITTIFEGGFVMSKTLNEPGLVAEQLRHYRRYLELTFSPKSELQSA